MWCYDKGKKLSDGTTAPIARATVRLTEFTVGAQGLGSIVTLGKLVLTLYAALVVFIVCVLGAALLLSAALARVRPGH